MPRFAIVRNADNKIDNMIDGVASFTPPALHTAVQIPDDSPVWIGWTYNAPDFLNQVGQIDSSQVAAQLRVGVAGALVRLRTIKTQATTFAAQAPYGTANLANLNDLLTKSQQIAVSVGDLADDIRYIARILSNQLDATT